MEINGVIEMMYFLWQEHSVRLVLLEEQLSAAVQEPGEQRLQRGGLSHPLPALPVWAVVPVLALR